MKIAIMQPYFFPYLGYISLIKHTDRFILFDDIQFIYHGWIERNRILNPQEGCQYIRVPLKKHSRETKIKDIIIANDINWKDKILAQIQHYKKRAPYFIDVRNIIERSLDIKTESIVELNLCALNEVLKYLHVNKKIEVFSEMNLIIDQVTAADEWALNICKSLSDIDEYWNPPGGMEFFNRCKYEKNGIKLKFHKAKLHEYNQRRSCFESGLSIIDVMMFNEVDDINKMLDDYELL